jgi:MFS transporter, DHA2 family, multidrug resistance protein
MSKSKRSNMQAQEIIKYPVGAERAILVVTAITAALLELIDTSIVNVSLQQISGSIGATTVEIAWAVTAYAISNVIMIPLSGMLGNVFGRRRYFTMSIIIFTVASLFCGMATSLWSLVAWRFIQGIGGGALLTSSQTIIVDSFPPEKISIANAIFGVGVILGPTFGPTLGGYLTDNFSWHWIFFINIPIGIVATYLSWSYVTDRLGATKPKKIDWWGIAFLVVSVGSLQFVLEEGQSKDWFASKTILFMTIIATIGLVAFIWRECTYEFPAVKLKLLKNWNLAIGSILNFVVGMILFATVFVFPLFVQLGLGWTATQTGNFMIPGALASAISMVVVGRLLSKGVNPKLIMLAGALMVISFAALMSFSSPDSTERNFFLPFILRGLGVGFMLAPVMTLSLQGISQLDTPQGAGISNMIRQLGGAVGIAIMNIVLLHRVANNGTELLQHTNVYNETFQDRVDMLTQNFTSQGYFLQDARQMAYKLTTMNVYKQQSLISYDNIFWIVAIALLVCIPIILSIRNNKQASVLPVDIH